LFATSNELKREAAQNAWCNGRIRDLEDALEDVWRGKQRVESEALKDIKNTNEDLQKTLHQVACST
jgi:hypothetical protein